MSLGFDSFVSIILKSTVSTQNNIQCAFWWGALGKKGHPCARSWNLFQKLKMDSRDICAREMTAIYRALVSKQAGEC